MHKVDVFEEVLRHPNHTIRGYNGLSTEVRLRRIGSHLISVFIWPVQSLRHGSLHLQKSIPTTHLQGYGFAADSRLDIVFWLDIFDCDVRNKQYMNQN